MPEYITLLGHIAYVAALTLLGFAAICSLLSRPLLDWVKHFEPESRIHLLRMWVGIPLSSAVITVCIMTLPSLTHSLITFNHCHHQGGCWWLPEPHLLSGPQFFVIFLSISLLLKGLANSIKHYRKSYLMQAHICSLVHAEISPGVFLLESEQPLAFSMGLRKPLAVLSTRLAQQLPSQQLEIICEHEQAHLRHRDSWSKWVFHFCSQFLWPSIAYSLRQENAIAMEQRADQAVACNRNDQVTVAETILSVQHLLKPLNEKSPGSSLLCTFASTAIERRITYLLADAPGEGISKPLLKAGFVLIVLLILGSTVPLHTHIESLITH